MPYWALTTGHVGLGDIDKPKAEFARLRRLAPDHAMSQTEGLSSSGQAEVRNRMQVFVRIAAGLEHPSALDALP